MVVIVVGAHNYYDCTVQKDKPVSCLATDTISFVGYVCRVSDTYDIFIEQIIKAKVKSPLLFALYEKNGFCYSTAICVLSFGVSP